MISIISSPWNFYYSPELRSQQEQGFQICSVFIQPSQETHTSVWGTWYPHKISSAQTHVIFPCQETRNVYLVLQVFHCALLSTHQVPEKQCENSSPELYTCKDLCSLLWFTALWSVTAEPALQLHSCVVFWWMGILPAYMSAYHTQCPRRPD